jgi:hypothetical protein
LSGEVEDNPMQHENKILKKVLRIDREETVDYEGAKYPVRKACNRKRFQNWEGGQENQI